MSYKSSPNWPVILTCLWLASAIARAAPQADQPWLRVQTPGVAQAFTNFVTPPAEYGLVLWWFWNGEMNQPDITRDLEQMRSHGARAVMVFPYYGMTLEYLSDAYFARIRFAVAEAKRLGLRFWLMDEGSYPSGFVGGRITRERPDLRMRVLAAGERFIARSGQHVSGKRDDQTIATVAVHRQSGQRVSLDGIPDWTAPPGEWEVRTVRWEYRTSATRHANREGFLKDSMYSFFDPLNTEGTQFFLNAVHEQYRKHIGDEFGKTVMGFMGDEPSLAGPPWTPRFLEEFARRKGYDLRPHLPVLLEGAGADLDKKVKADYFDVWTDLYNENFFRPQAEWCARYGMEYIVHLCGEEDTPTFIRLNGDYFKANRAVQIAGVDAIWRQIWPDKVADYPKLASSSAHLRGYPRAFTESFAVYGQGLSLGQAKWVFDHQAVRGINHFQAMEYLSSSAEHRLYFHPPHWGASPLWPYFSQFADYASRVSYLLSVGRPAARLALYFPTTSGWADDAKPDQALWAIARALLEGQRDFDLIDETSLASDIEIEQGALVNRSGQRYGALIFPPVRFLSARGLEVAERFAKAGGRVLFVGATPQWIAGRTYRDATAGSASQFVSKGVKVAPELNAAALAHLPPSDVTLTPPTADVKYLHRALSDGDVYYFFNEGVRKVEATATLAGKGEVQLWDPLAGTRTRLPARVSENMVVAPLVLEPHATAVLVIGGTPSGLPETPPVSLHRTAEIAGDWQLEIGGKKLTTPLRSWSDLGLPGFYGAATYRTQFAAPPVRAGAPVWLDLGEVRYAAVVRVNGRELERKAWGPFRWNITSALTKGTNVLEVEIANTRANELAGNDARFQEIEGKGWLRNSYIKMYLPFDREMIPSGLLGPVTLQGEERAK